MNAIGTKPYQDPAVIQRLVAGARTVAMVGLSANPLRPSHFVGFYLLRHGFRVIPVNPREREVLGQRSVASLAEIDVPVDIVDVFREPSVVPQLAFVHMLLASAYGLKGETERGAAELAEARRLRSDDRPSSIASVKALPGGYLALAPKIRALLDATYIAGLRKAGMPEE